MSEAKAQPEPSMEEILATISRIIAEDKPAGEAGAAGRPEEVLELTEAVAEDGTVMHLPSHQPTSVPAPADSAPPAVTPAVQDRILSAATSGATAAAFSQLAMAAQDRRRAGEMPIGGGSGRTLEDLVRDTVRPILQTWLDQNLPALVERLVREEIARVVGEAGLR